MLRLQLFGQPVIEQNGQRLTQFRSKKVEALLFFLAVSPGPQSRGQLADLLWPELPETKALGNLRYALWNLKQVIKNAPLVADRLFVTFSPDESTRIDVLEYQQQVARAGVDASAASLQRAADLYRGDFLDGFGAIDSMPFNDWLRQQQTHYREMAIGVLEQLASHHTNHHDFTHALVAIRRLLELDPWHEEFHRRLMRLLALTGQRPAALAHYEQCRQMLASELDLEPEPETMALVERIRLGETLPEPESRARVGTETAPFVGRATEFAWLRAQWEEIQPGESRLALIRGEVGVGKTRLVDELLRTASLQAGVVLRGRCFEFSGPVPYQPLATALTPALLQNDLRAWGLSDVWLTELAQLVPELRDKYPDLLPLALPTGADRYRLFEAAGQCLQILSAEQPLLLFIDDLHWADPNTLDLVSYLIQRPAPTGLLVVGTYRPEEISSVHPLTILRDGLYRYRRVSELYLGRLKKNSVLELVQAAAPSVNSGRLASFLYDVSEGNPFILIETLKEMREQGQLGSSLPEKIAVVPREVQATLQQRLNRLSPGSRELLRLAAVIGREFNARLLVVAGKQPEATVIGHLDDWLGRGLIREVGPEAAAGMFDFSHDLIRAVEYEQLSEHRKELLHRHVAGALEQLPDAAAHVEQLAYHTHRGRQHHQALHFLQQAAQKARSVYALPQAVLYYQQALEHWLALYDVDQASISELRQRWDLMLARLQVMEIQGRWQEMQQALGQVSAEVERWGTDEDRLRVIVPQVSLLYRLGDLTGCQTLARDGLLLAGQLVDQLAQGHCYQALGGCALIGADYAQALVHYEAALINFAQSGKTYQAGRCMNRIAETYLITNRFEQALACLQEARAYARAGRHQDVLVASLHLQARVYLFSGDFEQATATVEQALKLSESIGFMQALPDGYGLFCLIYLWTGELEQARKASRQVAAGGVDHHDGRVAALASYHEGLLQLAGNNPAGAIDSLSAASALDGRHEIERLSYLAKAYRALNQTEAAVRCSEEAIKLLIERNCGLEASQRIFLNHFHILQSAGRFEAAATALESARELVARQVADLKRLARRGFLSGLPWNREIVATRPTPRKPSNPRAG